MLERRSLLAAGGLLVLPRRTTAQPARSVVPLPGMTPLSGVTVADCAALRAADARAAAEAARQLTHEQVEAEVGVIMAALKRRQAVAAAAESALRAARVDLARQAVYGALDAIVAACLPSQNLPCIASAYGVKIVGGSADAMVQLYQARSPQEQAQVAVVFVRDRAVMFRELAGDLTPRPIYKAAIEASKRLVKITVDLAKAGVAVGSTKADFDAALSAFGALDKAYGTPLASEAEFRLYRRQHFEAQRWLPQLLLTAYPTTCRTDSLPTPLP